MQRPTPEMPAYLSPISLHIAKEQLTFGCVNCSHLKNILLIILFFSANLLSLIACLIVSPSLCGQQKVTRRLMEAVALIINPKAWRLPYTGLQR
jgi:hypothetical protein